MELHSHAAFNLAVHLLVGLDEALSGQIAGEVDHGLASGLLAAASDSGQQCGKYYAHNEMIVFHIIRFLQSYYFLSPHFILILRYVKKTIASGSWLATPAIVCCHARRYANTGLPAGMGMGMLMY